MVSDRKKEQMKQYYCDHKEERKAYRAKHYLEHGEECRTRSRRWKQGHQMELREKREIIKNWFYENLEELSCMDCGLSFMGQPWIADFHHTKHDGTDIAPTNIMVGGSYNRTVKELNKGVFLCPTCHRIEHRYPPKAEEGTCPS